MNTALHAIQNSTNAIFLHENESFLQVFLRCHEMQQHSDCSALSDAVCYENPLYGGQLDDDELTKVYNCYSIRLC